MKACSFLYLENSRLGARKAMSVLHLHLVNLKLCDIGLILEANTARRLGGRYADAVKENLGKAAVSRPSGMSGTLWKTHVFQI